MGYFDKNEMNIIMNAMLWLSVHCLSNPCRIIQINYDVVDEFGTDSSQLIKIMRAQEQLERQRQRHSPEVETSSSNTLTEN